MYHATESIKAVRGYKALRRIAGRASVIAPNRVQRQFTVMRARITYTYTRTWQGWLSIWRWLSTSSPQSGGLVDETHAVPETGAGCADDGRMVRKIHRAGHRELRLGPRVW